MMLRSSHLVIDMRPGWQIDIELYICYEARRNLGRNIILFTEYCEAYLGSIG